MLRRNPNVILEKIFISSKRALFVNEVAIRCIEWTSLFGRIEATRQSLRIQVQRTENIFIATYLPMLY